MSHFDSHFNVNDETVESRGVSVVTQASTWSREIYSESAFKALEEMAFKARICNQFKETEPSKKAAKRQRKEDPVPEFQIPLLSILNSYTDVLLSSLSIDKEATTRTTYVLHALNHVFKTRDRILKNTERINASERKTDAEDVNEQDSDGEKDEAQKDAVDGREEDENEQGDVVRDGEHVEYRDQGFTRPKVLFLLPFRNVALDVVQTIIQYSGASQIENKARFQTDFSVPADEDSGPDPSKPADFQHDFRGNVDDCFRLGIQFRGRRHLKLFSEFYSSDIIVASPLGLRMVIGAEGDKERDFDFLSSIEVLVVDRCDALLMQNWDHVTHIFQHLNKIPTSAHDCDFGRIRQWYLDGKAGERRQTILTSQLEAPEVNALFSRNCKNVDGNVRIKAKAQDPGAMGDIVGQYRQLFQRVQCGSLREADDKRFEYFCQKTYPHLKRLGSIPKGTVIFVPSYLDYVRVRNFLKEKEVEFGDLCEYTSNSNISRTRTHFFHGDLNLILTTERFHFFRRYKIRGIQRILFYQLPMYAHFYAEWMNQVSFGGDSSEATQDVGESTVLYTTYDRFRVERVVGKRRAERLLLGEKETYLFA